MSRTVFIGDPRSAGRPALPEVDRESQTEPLGRGAGELHHIQPLVGKVTQPAMADTLEAGGVHARERLPTPTVKRDDAQFRTAETGRRQFLQLARNLLPRHDAVPPEPIDPGPSFRRWLGKAVRSWFKSCAGRHEGPASRARRSRGGRRGSPPPQAIGATGSVSFQCSLDFTRARWSSIIGTNCCIQEDMSFFPRRRSGCRSGPPGLLHIPRRTPWHRSGTWEWS